MEIEPLIIIIGINCVFLSQVKGRGDLRGLGTIPALQKSLIQLDSGGQGSVAVGFIGLAELGFSLKLLIYRIKFIAVLIEKRLPAT